MKSEMQRWLSKWDPSPSSTLCSMASNTLCSWVPTKTNLPQHLVRFRTFWVDQQAITWARGISNSSLWTSCRLASLLRDRLIRWSSLSRTLPLPALLKSHQQPTWCSGSSLHLTWSRSPIKLSTSWSNLLRSQKTKARLHSLTCSDCWSWRTNKLSTFLTITGTWLMCASLVTYLPKICQTQRTRSCRTTTRWVWNC